MRGVPWLDPERLGFPDPAQALDDPNGLLAIGGDLSLPRLLLAYRLGIFPWYEEGQPILWWSPDPRTVLLPEQIHVSRSLRKTLRNKGFHLTMDQAFPDVIRFCARHRGNTGTWITRDMRQAYIELHRTGHAHSVETWLDGQLIGGLYGVALGRVFFGESMFSIVPDASKVAMVYLCGQLRSWGFKLIDCQVHNGHLERMGARLMARSDFQRILASEVASGDRRGKWKLDWHPAGSDSSRPSA